MTRFVPVIFMFLLFCSCDNVFSGGSLVSRKKPVEPPPVSYRISHSIEYTIQLSGRADINEEINYVYDAENRLVEKQSVWDEGYYYRTFYYYDSSGLLERCSTVYEVEPDASHAYYFYDGLNRLVRCEFYDYAMQPSGYLIYTYTDSSMIRDYYSSTGSFASSLRYYYGEKNKIIRYELHYPAGLDSYHLYVYRLDGNLGSIQYYHPDQDMDFSDEFIYDESFNNVRVNRLNSDSSLQSYYYYEYDEHGNLTGEYSYDPDGTYHWYRLKDYEAYTPR